MSDEHPKLEFAREALQVLQEECGLVLRHDEIGPDPTVYQFERSITGEERHHGVEFRFIGGLGFGGKFHLHGRHFAFGRAPYGDYDYRCYVSCYPEDRTAKRDKMIAAANVRLSALADKYKEAFADA